jgi:hypothetical protein
VTVTARMLARHREQLEEIAAREGVKVSELVRRAVTSYLEAVA